MNIYILEMLMLAMSINIIYSLLKELSKLIKYTNFIYGINEDIKKERNVFS